MLEELEFILVLSQCISLPWKILIPFSKLYIF